MLVCSFSARFGPVVLLLHLFLFLQRPDSILSDDAVRPTLPVELGPGTTITGQDMSPLPYEQFLGIPFAQPPLGNLRFRDPQPLPLWPGNRMAVDAQPQCWQSDPQTGAPIGGSEDCLYLNLFRPLGAVSGPLPVVVFIHGGGFFGGYNHPAFWGPDYFMATKEVILVLPTYRTNIFGFIATGDEAAPGNYGLKDQTMALRWVRDNVAAFGGDPNRVTLMGQSAGAVSVMYHLLSPLSQGLFRNAIPLSGAINNVWAMPMSEPREYVNRHATLLGLSNPENLTSGQLIDQLRQVPAEELVVSALKLYEWENIPLTNYLPAVEPPNTPGAFLTEDPIQALARGHFHQVPTLLSLVHNDGINFMQPLLTPGDKWRALNERLVELLPRFLYFNSSHPNIGEIIDRIRFKYLGSSGLFEGEPSLAGAQAMATDYFYGRPMVWSAEQLLKKKEAPTYVLHIKYRGAHTLAYMFTHNQPREYRASHCDELLYLFRMRVLYAEDDQQLNGPDVVFQETFMRHIMNFILHNDPKFGDGSITGYEQKMTVIRNDPETGSFAVENVDWDRDSVNYQFWGDIMALYNNGQ